MNIKSKAIIFIFFCSFILLNLQSCFRKPTTPSIVREVEVKTPIVHIVGENETLEEISFWYTGKESNKKKIATYNHKTIPLKLKKGEKIIIPSEIVIRKEKFKKKSNTETKKPNKIKQKVKKPSLEKVDPSNDLTNTNQEEEKAKYIEEEETKQENNKVSKPDLPEPELVEPENSKTEQNLAEETKTAEPPPDNQKDARRIELLKELLEK